MKNENKSFCYLKLDPKKFSVKKVKKILSQDADEGVLWDNKGIDVYENDDGSTAVYIPMDYIQSSIAMLDLLSDFEVENPPNISL